MHIRVLLERSFSSLSTSTRSSFGNSRERDANTVQVRNLQYTPSIQQGVLRVTSETFSSVTGDGPYQTVMELTGLQFIDESTYNAIMSGEDNSSNRNDVYAFTATDGSNYYILYTSGSSTDAKVNCTCKDFRWRFAYYNAGDGSLAGEPPEPYVSKTNRPPVNPDKSPGLCKHLLKLKKELEREEIFRKIL